MRQALYEAPQLFFYQQMLAYVLITAVLVSAVNCASEGLHRRHQLLQASA